MMNRIKCGWMKWRVESGVLSDKKSSIVGKNINFVRQ